MNRLVQAELLKLQTTRSTRRLVLVFAALAVLLTCFAVVVLARRHPGYEEANGYADLARAGGLSGTMLLVLGVMTTTGEAHYRTLSQTYLATPTRWRVLAAKLAAVATAGVVLPLALTGLATVTAVVQLAARGLPLGLDRMDLPQAAAGAVVTGVLLGVLGAALGAVVGSQTSSLNIALAWTLAVEGILFVFLSPDIGRWLPTHAVQAVAGRGFSPLPTWGALLVVMTYLAVASGIAVRFSLPRDVT